MIQQNWDLSFTIQLAADDEAQAASLLREIGTRIKNGKTEGDASYCAGVYKFEAGEIVAGLKRERDELRAALAAVTAERDKLAAVAKALIDELDKAFDCPVCDGEAGSWATTHHNEGCQLEALRQALAALEK